MRRRSPATRARHRRAYCLSLAILCLLAGDARLAAAAARPAAPKSRPQPAKPRYRIEVAVDLDAGRYAGRQTVRYANRLGDKVGALRFDLYPNVGAAAEEDRVLKVTAARSGERALETRAGASWVEVRLAEPLEPGAEAEVTLEFEGRAVRRAREEIDLEAHVMDQVRIVLDPSARRFRKGSDLVAVSGDAMLLGNPFPVLSVPKGGERGPTAGDYVFSESSEYRIEVTAPAGVDVLASGAPAGALAGGAHVFEGDALRSVALFVSRGFVSLEDESAGVRLRSVHREEHAAAARRALAALRGAVSVYAGAFGPPPITNLVVVEAPLAPGTSAAAFSGVVAAASAYYTDVRGAEGRDLPGFVRDTPELMEGELEFAVMREAARQWWGEGVGSDPRRASVLTEGLSSYSAVIATERLQGPEAAARAVEQRFRTPYRVYRMFGGKDLAADGEPASYPNYFAYSAIVESKTGLFFEAVRREVGDDAFFEGLRRYYESYSGGIARPQDLAAAVGSTRPGDAKGKAVARLYDRWIKERHGDEDIGEPAYSVAVSPGVADPAESGSDERPNGAERFGRFVVRMFVNIGKTAAKPF